jgi:hypothetical protein
MNTGKMVKTANVIDKVLRIFRVCLLAGCILCVVLMVLVPIYEEAFLEAPQIDLGNISLAITDNSIVDRNTLILSLEMALITDLISCASVWYAFTLILRIIAPMKEGRPFDTGVSKQIRRLAWVTLVFGGITELMRAVTSYIGVNAYDISPLLNASIVSEYSYNGKGDLSFLAGAALLFFLSYIFRYGEELQRESDETL